MQFLSDGDCVLVQRNNAAATATLRLRRRTRPDVKMITHESGAFQTPPPPSAAGILAHTLRTRIRDSGVLTLFTLSLYSHYF